MLDGNEVISGNNGLVMIVVKALRTLAVIFLRFMITEIRRVSFSREHIAAMPLLAQNVNDAVRRPLSRVPKIGLAISFNELIGDLLS